MAMSREELLSRVVADPQICGGRPCLRGTRIDVSVVLDALAEGHSPEQIVDHYPALTVDDVHAAAAYGAELARENIWKVSA